MLSKSEILESLSTQKQLLYKQFHVSEVGLFGSYVRDEQTEISDIDILIDFEKGKTSFDNFLAAYDLLESLFPNKKVEVLTVGGLSKYIGPYILKEVVYV